MSFRTSLWKNVFSSWKTHLIQFNITISVDSLVLHAMKGPINKTKIVIRHLPPSISQSTLMEQIDSRFSNRYKWFSFRAGKTSYKNQRYSHTYIDFHTPEDVIEFAVVFDGRTFVNEKGSQFKAFVEYAPLQSVPKVSAKKDGREGTILKGVQKEPVIITPLMEFIRQRRAAKNESQQKISISRRFSRRTGEPATNSSSSSKRDAAKRRVSTSMCVLRGRPTSRGKMKEKSAYTILSKKEDQQILSDFKTETVEGGNKISKGADAIGSNGTTSAKYGKVETSIKVPGILSLPNTTASVRNISNSTYRQRHGTNERVIRGILFNNNKVELRTQEVKNERDKQPSHPPNPHIKSYSSAIYDGKQHIDGYVTILSNTKEKQQITRDKDASNSSIAAYDAPLSHREIRSVLPNPNRNGYSLTENGAIKHVGCHGKDGDKFPSYSEGKQSKRMSTNFGSCDRQVWVQKSGSGS